jgi:hypothetical protein
MQLVAEQENADELMVEFRRNPDFATAMRIVQERHRELDELEKRKAEAERREAEAREARKRVAEAVRQNAPPLAPPTPLTPPKPAQEEDPVLRVTFTVTGPRSKLRAMKNYILQEGLDIG